MALHCDSHFLLFSSSYLCHRCFAFASSSCAVGWAFSFFPYKGHFFFLLSLSNRTMCITHYLLTLLMNQFTYFVHTLLPTFTSLELS